MKLRLRHGLLMRLVVCASPAMADLEGDQWDLMILVAVEAAALVEQRHMENDYLDSIGLTPNMIFRRAAGFDVDVFTIGFHEDMAALAAPGSASDAEREKAARTAGFKDRSDVSFHLRSLISGHHDTLAVKVE